MADARSSTCDTAIRAASVILGKVSRKELSLEQATSDFKVTLKKEVSIVDGKITEVESKLQNPSLQQQHMQTTLRQSREQFLSKRQILSKVFTYVERNGLASLVVPGATDTLLIIDSSSRPFATSDHLHLPGAVGVNNVSSRVSTGTGGGSISNSTVTSVPTTKQGLPQSGNVVTGQQNIAVGNGRGVNSSSNVTGTTNLKHTINADDSDENILSRRKLQALLDFIDPNERIDDDVQEVLVDIADDFVENVAQFACRLAKHRGSDTLGVRDIQLHLEQSWNLRVPGYGMDPRMASRPDNAVVQRDQERRAAVSKSIALEARKQQRQSATKK